MFKRRVEDSGKSTYMQFAFKIFFVHIINIIIGYILLSLLTSVRGMGIEMSYEFMYVVLTLVCFIYYELAVYVESWRTGERDYNLVMYNHIEHNKYKGLIASIISQIPSIFLAIVMMTPLIRFDYQKLLRAFYFNFFYPVFYFDEILRMRVIYFVPVVLAIVPAVVGYHMGYRGRRGLDRIMYKQPRKAEKKEQDL